MAEILITNEDSHGEGDGAAQAPLGNVSFEVPYGDGRCLWVGVGAENGNAGGGDSGLNPNNVSAVTYGGVAMTAAGDIEQATSSPPSKNSATCWYLVNPPVGTNDLVFTSDGAGSRRWGVFMVSMTGVDPDDPLDIPTREDTTQTTPDPWTVPMDDDHVTNGILGIDLLVKDHASPPQTFTPDDTAGQVQIGSQESPDNYASFVASYKYANDLPPPQFSSSWYNLPLDYRSCTIINLFRPKPVPTIITGVDPQLEDRHTQSLANYLPSGLAFAAKNIPGTVTRDLLRGLATELLRVEGALEEFRDEILPDTTTLLLEEWESALGIPDLCFTGTGTNDVRRRDILAKLVSLGVQTQSDFIRLANIFGVDATIIPGMEERALFSTDKEARHFIVVDFNLPAGLTFTYTFPIVFGSVDLIVVECLLRSVKPAHCDILFTNL